MKSLTGKAPFDFSSAKACYHNLSGKNPFAFSFGCHKPRTGYQYDMHYGLEIGIVLDGKMNLFFPDFKTKLAAGNVWFCGMWEPHGWSAGEKSYEEVNLIIWPPALVAMRYDEPAPFNWPSPFTAPSDRRPQTAGEARRAMLELGLKIKECLTKKGKRTWEWLRVYVMEAILLATEQWSEEKLSSPAPVGSLAELGQAAGHLNRVLCQFFDNRGKMTTGEAAKICGLNRNAFGRMFHGLMGLPFADFVLRYRLDAAASSLHQTDESVKSIALYWGFADTSHFDRLFARYYGCTPHEYRQKNSANA